LHRARTRAGGETGVVPDGARADAGVADGGLGVDTEVAVGGKGVTVPASRMSLETVRLPAAAFLSSRVNVAVSLPALITGAGQIEPLTAPGDVWYRDADRPPLASVRIKSPR
jgi:hypothetical protein